MLDLVIEKYDNYPKTISRTQCKYQVKYFEELIEEFYEEKNNE